MLYSQEHDDSVKLGRIIYSESEIQERVKELAAQISRDYAGSPVHLLAVLRGAIPFLADLSRYLTLDVTFDFLSVVRDKKTNHVRLLKDLDSLVEGRHILIVEDIINEGETLNYLVRTLSLRDPKSIKIVTMFDRPKRHSPNIEANYVGFCLEDQFVVGYGLDYQQHYRNLPCLAELKILNPDKK
ncbi:MAG: hypoxanthine phosphoribosyltransferase [Candidatus Bruticola sp.]